MTRRRSDRQSPGALAVGWVAAVDPGSARDDARRILRRDEYQPGAAPRPFRGVLRWLGDRLDPVLRAFAPLTDNPWFGLTVVGAVTLLAVAVAVQAIRRRGAATSGERRQARRAEGLDPDDLDRRAAQAEVVGDLEGALRLRYRAGLVRLDRSGAIRYHDGVTSAQVSSELAIGEFDGLAATFDEVVYGRRPASPTDLDQARIGWPSVLAEARR